MSVIINGTGGGGGGTPGAPPSSVQFNNAGAFGGIPGSSVDTSGAVTLNNGTLTASDPVLNLSQTWNNGAVTFDGGLVLNVVNTASASGSLMFDLQSSGTSVFNVDPTGIIQIGGTPIFVNGVKSNISIVRNSSGGNVVGHSQRNLATDGFSELNAINDGNPDIARMYMGLGGSTASQPYTNVGYIIAQTGLTGMIIQSLPVGHQCSLCPGLTANLVLDIGDGFHNSNGWFNYAGQVRLDQDFSVTNSTVLVNVTGSAHNLSVTVQAGRTYAFDVYLTCSDAAAGGVQAAIGGTCTATAIIYDGWVIDSNAIKGQGNSTALGGAVASSVTAATTGIVIQIKGLITVNTLGTLTVQFAQNSSNGTASIVRRGSYFIVQDIS